MTKKILNSIYKINVLVHESLEDKKENLIKFISSFSESEIMKLSSCALLIKKSSLEQEYKDL